jgi:hypothetical protein
MVLLRRNRAHSMNFLVKNAFYLNGELVQPGSEVELTEEQAGYFAPKDVLGRQVESVLGGEEPDNEPDEDGLKHLGGGVFELPDGKKIKGKSKALEALKALKVGEPDAQDKAGDTTADGASDT